MKKKILIYSISVGLSFCLGLTTSILLKNPSKDSLSTDVDIPTISYQDYQDFYEYIIQNIKIDDLEVKYFSKHDNYTIIEKSWSFDTRDRLFLDESNHFQPTEEVIILEDKEQKYQVTISICYNKHFIGNNLHNFITSSLDLDNINHDLSINTNSALLSYENLLISIQQSRIDSNNNFMIPTIEEIVSLTTNYFDK